jgi:2,3-bisphosphoglycerate-independent phosphoglycerate mutase
MAHDPVGAAIRQLVTKNETKIVLLVMDGVGGMRTLEHPTTELEEARTPNLDKWARRGSLGRVLPAARGITVGSGPGHLALFGYNPLLPEHEIGRGVLEVAGIDYAMPAGAVAARGNFATLDASGNIVDRRAGRLGTEEAKPVLDKMQAAVAAPIDGVTVRVLPVKEYRFALVFEGPGLGAELYDTDPQKIGVPSLEPRARRDTPENARMVAVAAKAIALMRAAIKDEAKANGFNLRGFAQDPGLETFEQRFGLRAAAIATYPLYRGVARLCGMNVVETGTTIADEFRTLRQIWNDYDFFFLHVKKTDAMGEDGNRAGKIMIIEDTDRALMALDELKPDVLVVTGDHSTPPPMKAHSFHPVPFLLASALCDIDAGQRFTEGECDKGTLGVFPSCEIMQLALGHAGRLLKFGS